MEITNSYQICEENLYARGINSTFIYDTTIENATIEFLRKNKNNIDILNKFGIDENYTLDEVLNYEYTLNNYDFRSDFNYSVNNQPDEIWCIGCSFTFGVGVSKSVVWPSLVQQEFPNNLVKNFGIGASGPLTQYRLLNNWLHYSEFKPKVVYILGFFPYRIEASDVTLPWDYQTLTHLTNLSPILDIPKRKRTDHTRFLKKFFTDCGITAKTHYSDIQLKIKKLLKDNDIPFKIIEPGFSKTWYDTYGIDFQCAGEVLSGKLIMGKDTIPAHPGPQYHRNIVQKFIND